MHLKSNLCKISISASWINFAYIFDVKFYYLFKQRKAFDKQNKKAWPLELQKYTLLIYQAQAQGCYHENWSIK